MLMRSILPRLPVFIYLAAAGGLCAVAATGHQSLQTDALYAGIAAIPVALLWLILDVGSVRRQRAQIDTYRGRETRLKAIADGPGIGLFLTDLDGHIVQANRPFRELLGFNARDLRGKNFSDLTFRSDQSVETNLRRELLAGERDSYVVEKRLVRQSNQIAWVHMTVSLVRDEGGNPQFIAGAAQDITEQKQSGTAMKDVEQLFRKTFDQAAVGVAHTDREGRFMFANRRLGEMFGYRREDLFGREFHAFVHPDDVDASDLALRQLMNGAIQEYSGEQRYLRRGGSTIWGHLSMSVVQEPDGEPKYGIVMIEDITDRKQAQEALRESEARFRAITETASDAIVTMDESSRILFANPATTAIFGYAEDELVGRPFSMLLPAQAQGTAMTDVASYLHRAADGGLGTTELTGLHKDGGELCLEIACAESTEQQRRAYTCIIRDISERKRAEEERAELVAREQEARAVSDASAVIRRVVDASPLSIVTLDPEGRVVSWNAAAAKTFGWAESDVVGRPVPFEAGDGPSESDGLRERALHGETVTNLEISRRTRDGMTLDLSLSTAPIHDASGAVDGIMFVYADITERKLAEKELHVQRDFALQVMNTMGQGLATTDADGRFEYVNPAYAEMLGYEPEELIGKSQNDFTVADDHTIVEEALGEQREGKGSTYETHMSTSQSDDLFVLHTLVPRWRDHAVNGAIVVATDLTERKQTEEVLAQARDQALEASRLKSQFLATVSHEIRTPMNAIMGMTELLLETSLDEEQKEFVGVVDSSAQALLTIINDILDLSKIEADKLVLDNVDFEPLQVVEGAAELLATKAREKELSLVTFVDPAIPSWLRGDAGRLRQILLNLIGNALKFTEHGEVVIQVSLEAATDAVATVRFAVTDTGIGLPAAAQKRLFQPFVQADGSTTRKYGGTGLGLAICKRLTELMGGTIGAQSSEGRGSTFWFHACFERASTAPSSTPRPSLHGLRVLVADENAMSRGALRRTLEAWGMHVDESGNGHDALDRLVEAASATPYDIVVTEHRLPDMEGFELGRTVRREPALSRTQVILFTAFDERGRGEAAVQAGFAAYLTKPAKQSQVIDAVASAASRTVRPSDEKRAAAPVLAAGPALLHSADGERGALLLLVEDNVTNQIMTMRQLEKLGHAVHIVSNGVQAVKTLTYGSSRYDLVFMDCMMPEMDGFEATRQIRLHEVTTGRHVPIIGLTANALEGDRERCIEAGMDDYMSKPVSRHQIKESLDRWLSTERPVAASGDGASATAAAS
jgi:two-component system, sensor histidine kinase and response regulator